MLVLVVVVTILLFWLNSLRIRNKEPPLYPGALPLVGHVCDLLTSFTNSMNKLTQLEDESFKLGHSYTIIFGNIKFYVLADPEDCNAVAHNFVEKPSILSKYVADLFGCGLLCSKQIVWHRHRKLMNPMFTQQMLDGFIQIFNANAKRLVAELDTVERKGFFDPMIFMRKATVRNTFASMTGAVQYDDDESVLKIIDATNTLKDLVIERFRKTWLSSDTIFNWSYLKKVHDFNINLLKDEITSLYYQTKRTYSELPSSEIYDVGRIKTFLDIFVQLENEGLLSESEILDELITLALSSFDTSSTLLTYALACIGTYPHVQDRVFQEIKENISSEGMNGYDTNKISLSKMNYLDAVIKETLRVHTVFPIIARHLNKNINIKNYTLHKGNNCMLLINAINQHSIWGKDALEFKPERWLNPKTLPKNSYIYAAFGLGRRNCIGKPFAMLQSKLLLAHVLMNYKILGNHNNIKKKYVLILEPISGHHISITRRQ